MPQYRPCLRNKSNVTENEKCRFESYLRYNFFSIFVKMETIIVGSCPICDRDMLKGPSIDRHHFYPKCKGGRETEWVHKICHRKIHSVFTESELAKEYNNAEIVRSHPETQLTIGKEDNGCNS